MEENVRKDLEGIDVKVKRIVDFISLYGKLERSSLPATSEEEQVNLLEKKAKEVVESSKYQTCPDCGKILQISAGIRKPMKRSGLALRIHGSISCPDPECGYVGKYSRMVK